MTEEPTASTLAVLALGAPAVAYAATTGQPPWLRVVAAFVPLTGLLLGHTRADRLYMLPAVTLLLLWAHIKEDRLWAFVPPLLVGISAGLVGGGVVCDAWAVVSLDVAAFLVAAVQLLRARPHPPWQVVASLFEAAIVVFIVAVDPTEILAKGTHLTWWGLVALAAFDYARAVGLADSVVGVVLSLQLCVVVGVWFMSAAKCDLLTNSYRDVGPSTYAVGNFAMHYWPSLRVVLYRPVKVWSWQHQLTITCGIISVYLATTDPRTVYGCDSWVTQERILLAFVAVAAACGTLAWTAKPRFW
ncbi:MAG: hypothetical protein ACPGR8_06925 [Limisphaerales bacterium]